jgi:hypothetical protein
VFEGAQSVRPVRLPANEPVTLRFFIGPRDDRNAVAGEKWTVNPALLSERGKLGLTVAMFCDICFAPSLQVDAVTYDGSLQKSTEARFEIRADPRRAPAGRGTVLLSVSKDGQEYDNVPVDVLIGSAEAAGDVSEGEHPWDPPPPEADPVDFVLTATGDTGGRLQLTCEPINEKFKASVGRLCVDPDGRRRVFRTAPASQEHIRSTVTTVFATLKALASPLEDKLRRHLAGSASGLPKLDTLDNMGASDASKLLDAMIAPAQLVYKDLFLDGGDDLEAIIGHLEHDNLGRPPRVAILVGNVAVPWQLLHPTGPLNASDVWGFKFELAVVPLRPRPGRIATSVSASAAKSDAIFGLYGNKGADEEVYTLGRNNLRALRKLGLPATAIQTKGDLIHAFTSTRDQVRLFVTYTHGHSGIAQTGAALGADAAGPRIDFDVDNYVSADDLERLAARTFTPTQYRRTFFFGGRPAIVLNACETGASAYAATAGNGFPEVLLQMGARGVVTTEGPVPVYFGYYFGQELLERLVKGGRFPGAVLETRRVMWSKRNPLGLLYGYSGSPYAKGL